MELETDARTSGMPASKHRLSVDDKPSMVSELQKEFEILLWKWLMDKIKQDGLQRKGQGIGLIQGPSAKVPGGGPWVRADRMMAP